MVGLWEICRYVNVLRCRYIAILICGCIGGLWFVEEQRYVDMSMYQCSDISMWICGPVRLRSMKLVVYLAISVCRYVNGWRRICRYVNMSICRYIDKSICRHVLLCLSGSGFGSGYHGSASVCLFVCLSHSRSSDMLICRYVDARWHWDLQHARSWKGQRIYIYMIYSHIYVYIYIYAYISICIYMWIFAFDSL